MPQSFSPTDVMMGRPSGGGSSPYLWSGKGSSPAAPAGWNFGKSDVNPAKPAGGGAATYSGTPAQLTVPASSGTAPKSGNVLGPESIRATGTGPFDAAYRQNLATYAGGQFSRPGGSMNFNPTDPSTFPGMATGGGTAPVTGMPNTLLDAALSGQGFGYQPPQPAQTAASPGKFGSLQEWIDQFMRNGRSNRMGSIA